jgi:hypothetical protein
MTKENIKKHNNIKKLLKQGLSNGKIADKLNIGICSVNYVIKKMKDTK